MTLEEKLDRMHKTAMEEARANGNKIIETHKTSVDHVFDDHKDVMIRQSKLTIKTETSNTKQQSNKAISTYQTELKREQGKVQKRLKKELFHEVNEQLQAFMCTDSYTDLLVSYIKKAQDFSSGSGLSIYVTEADRDKIPTLEKLTSTTISVYKEDFLGGIRAIVHDRNILINYSFASALAEEYDNFRFSGGGLDD